MVRLILLLKPFKVNSDIFHWKHSSSLMNWLARSDAKLQCKYQDFLILAFIIRKQAICRALQLLQFEKQFPVIVFVLSPNPHTFYSFLLFYCESLYFLVSCWIALVIASSLALSLILKGMHWNFLINCDVDFWKISFIILMKWKHSKLARSIALFSCTYLVLPSILPCQPGCFLMGVGWAAFSLESFVLFSLCLRFLRFTIVCQSVVLISYILFCTPWSL